MLNFGAFYRAFCCTIATVQPRFGIKKGRFKTLSYILVTMAVLEIILSAVFSTLLTVPVMLILYHKVIIPKILVGVKADLPPAIMAIVDQKLQEFHDFIEDKFESARMAILGKSGNQKRLLNYAARFLEKNGVTEDTVQTVADRYGQDILEMITKAAKPKEAEQGPFGTVKE